MIVRPQTGVEKGDTRFHFQQSQVSSLKTHGLVLCRVMLLRPYAQRTRKTQTAPSSEDIDSLSQPKVKERYGEQHGMAPTQQPWGLVKGGGA